MQKSALASDIFDLLIDQIFAGLMEIEGQELYRRQSVYSFEPSIPKSFKFSEPNPAAQKTASFKIESATGLKDEIDCVVDMYTCDTTNNDQLIPVDIPEIGDITRTKLDRKQYTPSLAVLESQRELE